MTQAYVPAALRRQVYERAHGYCEYCLVPETVALSAHQVDHIIAQKHGGLSQADNLALACALCNTP
jgi:5-methylcytosine-specific restriction endonuclease McrA